MITVVTNSPDETWELARKLAPLLSEGDVINLSGDLGAGKTVFTKGIAAGLDIHDPITSPTFTIIKEYSGRLPLYHFDVYRLGDPQELDDLAADEYFYSEGVCVVEWGDKFEDLLPEEHLTIELHRIVDENARRFEIIAHGKRWRDKVEAWLQGTDYDDFGD